MWRSIFLALGIMAIIFGLECLLIESASLYSAGETSTRSFMDPSGAPSAQTRLWQPKEWHPWLALCGGTVAVLYVFTLPQRFGRAEPA